MEDGYDSIRSEEDKKEGVTLKSDYYIQPFTTRKVVAKDWQKFVESTKQMVRQSDEYKEFIATIKQEKNLTHCAFLGNVDDCEGEVDIEIHHTPLTIHEVIEIIAYDMLQKGHITTFDVAHQVIQDHFAGIIGCIPVSVSIHELIHDGKINVNIDQIYGDVAGFCMKYHKSFPPEIARKLDAFIKVSDDVGILPDKDLLKVNEKVFVNPSSNKLSYQGVVKLLNKKEDKEEKKDPFSN